MKRSSIYLLASLLFYISLSACQRRHCESTASTAPASATEQQQLWERLINGTVVKATYEVLQYKDSAGTVSLDVLVYGDQLCGTMRLNLSQADASLQPLIQAKGQGYRGAVLAQPFIRAESGSSGTQYYLYRVGAIKD
jgi:hypothetical protein